MSECKKMPAVAADWRLPGITGTRKGRFATCERGEAERRRGLHVCARIRLTCFVEEVITLHRELGEVGGGEVRGPQGATRGP